MQKVSNRYKESMKKPVRDRGYIQVSFGIINHKVQSKARVSNGNFAYYTNNSRIFDSQTEKRQYATFEQNFTKLDGSMYFLPRQNSGLKYYDTGLVGGSLVSSGNYEVKILFGGISADLKGLTIDFGENYPVNFDVFYDSGSMHVVGNTDSKWITQSVINSATYIRVIAYSMKNPESRLRINSILFGYGLVYDNEYVIDSNLESYVSPIGQDVPQIDFSVVLNNYDHYFNVDDPESAINYLETGQEINVRYGYQLLGESEEDEDEIEWVQGANLVCSDWEATDTTATIRAQDIFRSMDSEYYKGTYNFSGVSFYNLAVNVLEDAGETSYYIDPVLKTIYTKNPLPRVKHKEALQMIANACRCVLFQTREGKISIKSNFKPQISAASNSQTSYSNVSNVLNSDSKQEYASFSADYTRLDSKMYFLPRNGSTTLSSGYTSGYQSDSNGRFSTNPIITLTQNAQCSYYSMRIIFGGGVPSEFIIRTYNNNSLVETIEFPNDEYTEIENNMYIIHDFDDLDKMEIEFVKTATPYNRIVVNNIIFEDVPDFVMRLDDITSSPKAIKQERVQEVIVPCFSYQTSSEQESLISEEVSAAANSTMRFFLHDPCYNYTARINGSYSGVTINNSGSYYVEVKFSSAVTGTLEILGKKYKVVEKKAIRKLYNTGQEGVTKNWENPLISDMVAAQNLANWLGDYYSSGIEYEYDNRGFPELDVNDVIHQERKTKNGIKEVDVNVYRSSIKFDRAFSGKLVARRQERGY